MLNLAEYRSRADRLADHLPWAALVAPGIILNKDGSFQRTLQVSVRRAFQIGSAGPECAREAPHRGEKDAGRDGREQTS